MKKGMYSLNQLRWRYTYGQLKKTSGSLSPCTTKKEGPRKENVGSRCVAVVKMALCAIICLTPLAVSYFFPRFGGSLPIAFLAVPLNAMLILLLSNDWLLLQRNAKSDKAGSIKCYLFSCIPLACIYAALILFVNNILLSQSLTEGNQIILWSPFALCVLTILVWLYRIFARGAWEPRTAPCHFLYGGLVSGMCYYQSLLADYDTAGVPDSAIFADRFYRNPLTIVGWGILLWSVSLLLLLHFSKQKGHVQ